MDQEIILERVGKMRKIWPLAVGVLLLVAASAAAAQASAPVQAAPAQTAEAPKPATSQGLEFGLGDWKVKFYGFVCLDVHYNDSHPNNTRLINTIKAEDDDAPAAIREEENSEDLTMHARNSRFGVDVTLPLLDFLEICGEVWQGKNVNDLRGGILQAGVQIGSDGEAGEVESCGYWAEILFKPLDWYKLCVGTSRDDPVNSDLTGTPALTGKAGAEDKRVCYVANRFNVSGGVSFGLDYLHWITKWRGGDY